jgi:hypothetical protein
MSQNTTHHDTGDDGIRDHLAGLDEGSGCIDAWEHLSKYRERQKMLEERQS